MDAPPKEVFSKVELLKSVGLDVPQAAELAFELKQSGIPMPDGILTEEECVAALEKLLKEK